MGHESKDIRLIASTVSEIENLVPYLLERKSGGAKINVSLSKRDVSLATSLTSIDPIRFTCCYLPHTTSCSRCSHTRRGNRRTLRRPSPASRRTRKRRRFKLARSYPPLHQNRRSHLTSWITSYLCQHKTLGRSYRKYAKSPIGWSLRSHGRKLRIQQSTRSS
jgi:hypothetical protein